MKDDRLYLIHISECIERVEKYTAAGKGVFFADTMVQDAVIRNLQVMAESAGRLSPGLQSTHADVDWRGISGFRNVLVHDYLGVKLERVWELVQQSVPDLKQKVQKMLKESGQ